MKQRIEPRPLFSYGTLRAMPLLAWAMTTTSQKWTVSSNPPKYPALLVAPSAITAWPSDPQREMLDEIEGEDSYEVVEVDAVTDSGEIVNADTYLWRDRHMDLILPDSSWELEVFVKEHLQSWLDLMTDDGIEDNADISSL